MYAVAFDLVVSDTEKHHPKGVTQAYTEIGAVLGEYGFRRVQGSLYDELLLYGLAKIAQQASISLQRLGGTQHNAGEIRMAWIDENVALRRHHGAGNAQ